MRVDSLEENGWMNKNKNKQETERKRKKAERVRMEGKEKKEQITKGTKYFESIGDEGCNGSYVSSPTFHLRIQGPLFGLGWRLENVHVQYKEQ